MTSPITSNPVEKSDMADDAWAANRDVRTGNVAGAISRAYPDLPFRLIARVLVFLEKAEQRTKGLSPLAKATRNVQIQSAATEAFFTGDI
jgi:hypothetical protein